MSKGTFIIRSRVIIGLLFSLNICLLINVYLKPSLHEINNEMIYNKINKSKVKSCLNDIYDEIFVISTPNRIKTLSMTLHQLFNEHIQYTLWQCHSSSNQHSINLWNTFKQKVDKLANKTYRFHEKHNKESSAYHSDKIFFLRQTQFDIMDYAKNRNLSKILLFEDDIILSNTIWFDMFCNLESFIPNWYILNIGVNQYDINNIKLINIKEYENNTMKYFVKNRNSYGTFGLSISLKMYPILLNSYNYYNINNSNNYKYIALNALDNYMRYIKNKSILKNSFNIHPNLILPDVTTSSIRNSRNETWFIESQTTDHNISRYSKYWKLRFGDNDTLQIQNKIYHSTPTFKEIMQRQRLQHHAPSDQYLHL